MLELLAACDQPAVRQYAYGGGAIKLVLSLLLASASCFLLASFLLFLGLQVLEMNQWQGAALGIAMRTLNIASLAFFIAAVWRGARTFRNRRRAVQHG